MRFFAVILVSAAEGRKLLSVKLPILDLSGSHGGSQRKRNEMIKKQRHARPWYDFSRYTAHVTPDVPGDDPKPQLLVLSDYMTKQGEYLGGNIPFLVFDGPEKETSKCEQYYTINEATGEKLTADPGLGVVATKLFCAAWTADEISHDETESGHCICKSVAPESDPQYCSSWECVQTEQHQSSSCLTTRSQRSSYYSSYSTSRNSYGSCYSRSENEYSEFTCTEAWPSGKSCKKWHGVETSWTTIEDERYVCTTPAADEKFCMVYVGETASAEEAEMSTTTCTVVADNGEYCETYVGTETGLSRYRYRIESLLTVFCYGIPASIACAVWFIIFGLGMNTACSALRSARHDADSCGDKLSGYFFALFFVLLYYVLPIGGLVGMLVMALLVGGTVPALVMAGIHAVLIAIVVAFGVRKYRTSKAEGLDFFDMD
jgi:hypothetical protein